MSFADLICQREGCGKKIYSDTQMCVAVTITNSNQEQTEHLFCSLYCASYELKRMVAEKDGLRPGEAVAH